MSPAASESDPLPSERAASWLREAAPRAVRLLLSEVQKSGCVVARDQLRALQTALFAIPLRLLFAKILAGPTAPALVTTTSATPLWTQLQQRFTQLAPTVRGLLFDPATTAILETFSHTKTQVAFRDPVVLELLETLFPQAEETLLSALEPEALGSLYEGLLPLSIRIADAPLLTLGREMLVVDLQALLRVRSKDRAATLHRQLGRSLGTRLSTALTAATTIPELQQALVRIACPLQPDLLQPGDLYLHVGDERRRSGSHYTPRSLTRSIVAQTLEPLLAAIPADAPIENYLDLTLCDPAMGGGAFLLECCRQLGDTLSQRLGITNARRLVAERCLYGVDKDPMAAELARLALILLTHAPDLPAVFVDHALRVGDSLVGVTWQQLLALHWDRTDPDPIVVAWATPLREKIQSLRSQIRDAAGSNDTAQRLAFWTETQALQQQLQLPANVLMACFFATDTDTRREKLLNQHKPALHQWMQTGNGTTALQAFVTEALKDQGLPLRCFHWELEFPEVLQ